MIESTGTEALAKEVVNESIPKTTLLLNGLLAALGAGLSFGLLAAVFSSFDPPDECSAIPVSSNASLKSRTLDEKVRRSVVTVPSVPVT